MRGTIWNSRGLRDLAKQDFLRSTSLEKRSGFYSLTQTH
jgi:lipoprotein NlpI